MLLGCDISIDKLFTIAVLVHVRMRMRGIDKLLAIFRQPNLPIEIVLAQIARSLVCCLKTPFIVEPKYRIFRIW